MTTTQRIHCFGWRTTPDYWRLCFSLASKKLRLKSYKQTIGWTDDQSLPKKTIKYGENWKIYHRRMCSDSSEDMLKMCWDCTKWVLAVIQQKEFTIASCCELFWTNPGSSTQQNSGCMATYLSSYKTFKQDMRSTVGEAKIISNGLLQMNTL